MNQVSSEHLPLDREAKVLDVHPTGIVALEKPSGVLTHPNRKGGTKAHALLRADYDSSSECYSWQDETGKTRNLYLVHRLDSPTSGVLLACRSLELAKVVRSLFAKRETSKTYYAIVREKAKAKDGIWKDRLTETREAGKLRVRTGNETEAFTKASFERRRVGRLGLSLLRLEPSTGRTHQLRVQSAARGFPIVGDRVYGDVSLNRRIARATKVDRLCLHASSIEINFSHEGKSHHFFSESALPRAFGKMLT